MNLIHPQILELLEEYNPYPEEIEEHTRLYHDLNIYGEDAEEFLNKYAEVFNVSLNSFPFTDYFPDEGDTLLPSLLRLITFSPKPVYKELTCGMLNAAIIQGALH